MVELMGEDKENRVRTIADLKDIRLKSQREFKIVSSLVIIWFVICVGLLIWNPTVPDWTMNIIGPFLVLGLIIGGVFLFFGPLITKQLFFGYYIPSSLSLSEKLRLGLDDLSSEIIKYSQRSEIQNRKKIGKTISSICNELIGVIEDPLNVGTTFYLKRLDILTQDLRVFSKQTVRVLDEIDARVHNQEDLPHNSIIQNISPLIEKIRMNGDKFVYDKFAEGIMFNLLVSLGLPKEEPPEEERERYATLKRVFGYPFARIIFGACIVGILYTTIVLLAKPEISNDTAWIGGIALIGTTVGCISAYEFKFSK